jgi:hypothetical protein
MPDTASLVIVHKFTYRDLPEEWSNKYHFTGTTPATRAAWKTLADAVIAAEKLTQYPATSFVRAYGYEAGNEISVAQIDYSVPPDSPAVVGTYAGSGRKTSGDVAATVRWWTGAYNSRGKKIYCRKFFHGIDASTSDADEVDPTHSTALATFAAKMIDGTLPGSAKYSGPQGATLSAPRVDPYLTTRTLKRRGKRPPTP